MEGLQTALAGVDAAAKTLGRNLLVSLAPTLIKLAGMLVDLEQGKPGAALKLWHTAVDLSRTNLLPGKPPALIQGANDAGRYLHDLAVGHGNLGAELPPGVKSQVRAAARKYGLDPDHMVKLARVEGGTGKISSAGAIGTMQLMPSTAAQMGVNPYNQAQNIKGGMKYYASLLARFHGDYAAADAAYNAGPAGRGVAHYFKTNDPSRLPAETRAYVRKINGPLPFKEGSPDPGAKWFSNKAGASSSMLPPSVTALVSHLRAIQPHHTMNDNRSHTETHIGSVTVHTKSTDPKGVAGAIKHLGTTANLASQANRGLM
jgi:hypothetical protein